MNKWLVGRKRSRWTRFKFIHVVRKILKEHVLISQRIRRRVEELARELKRGAIQ